MAARKAHSRPTRRERSQKLARCLVLAGVLTLWMLGLVARLYSLQIVHYVDLLNRAQRQQQHTVEVAAKRGVILDREMHPLAMSLEVDSICAVPAEVPNPGTAARSLARALHGDWVEILGRFRASRSFCWVQRKVSREEAARVRALNLKGIYLQKESKRFYPKGELAAQVMGFVGLDDKGLAGVEYQMDEVLRGRPGRVLVTSDARRQTFRSSEWEGQPGKNVVLTLVENIQYIAEKALAEAVRKWRPLGATVIVQNPQTGEILAMANRPTFSANEYAKSSSKDLLNRAVGWVYEPGSTFKLVTLSAALEEGLTSPQEVINCQHGSIVLAGHTIHDHKPFGDLTVEHVLAMSSDVGAIKLGLRLGEERLHRWIRNFGFASRSGVDLPGEERGLLRPPDRWSGISIGEMSIGQEVAVTPLQLATAYSAIANGGMLFQPRIVRDVFLGNMHDQLPPASGRRVVSEQTSSLMKQMLGQVLEVGTGVPARLNGYSAAGKTGTAQKIDESGHYSKSHYISSFVGFAPLDRPAITILVVIDSPVGAIYGSEVAAPVFRSIAEQTLGYLNVPLDNPSKWPQAVSSTPTRSSQPHRGDEVDFPPNEPEPPVAATSPVRLASLSSALSAGRRSLAPVDGPLLNVPDFMAQPEREVAEKSQELGLELSISGTGLAAEQVPPAGARVPAGSRVWVRFRR